MKKAIATLTALGALALAPTAQAALGDGFGLVPINGHPEAVQPVPAYPEDEAFWAGLCQRAAVPPPGTPIPVPGAGESPLTTFAPALSGGDPFHVEVPAPTVPVHCIDWGAPAPVNLPGESWTVAPRWRLPGASQAGAHPDGTTTLALKRIPAGDASQGATDGHADNVLVEVPPGLIANPQAVGECSQEIFAVKPTLCPPQAQVGILHLHMAASSVGNNMVGPTWSAIYPVWNLEPRKGRVAELGFAYASGEKAVTVRIGARLRSEGDFGATAFVGQIPAPLPLSSQQITLWGVPWAAANDEWRGQLELRPGSTLTACNNQPETGETQHYIPPGGLAPECRATYDPSWGPIRPFVINETDCNPAPAARVWVDAYQRPGSFDADGNPVPDPDWATAESVSPPVTGCGALEFSPDLDARPSTDAADSPSGLDVDLRIPQNEDPDGLATAQLKKSVVTLPEGLVLNPSAANGLAACSSQQIGLKTTSGAEPRPIRFDNSDPSDGVGRECPQASKIATVEVESPALADRDQPSGEAYIASPHDNPFDSLLALYIVVRSPERGLIAKLAGEVRADPRTGQLTTTFDHNPQLPVSELRLDLEGGARAPLRTPATCGEYATVSRLVPWSDPGGRGVTSTDRYEISKGPGGGPCADSEAELPHAPGFQAGTVSPIAGAHSPFVLNLRRSDGSQNFGALTIAPPPGLVAKLAGTPYCPEAALAAAAAKDGREEQTSPSCPAASRVGAVHAAAGAGPDPYWTQGTAYLTGPYKGAPLSLAIVAPAVAGPFDLGTVVVRTALHVHPHTAQITAVADPIPHILEGIPLDVREVSVRLDRPNFTLNPTSCNPMAVSGTLLSTQGALAALTQRFQLAECRRLGFEPRMSLRLHGGVKRGKYQGLRAVVRPRPGDANISRTAVRMPRSAFLAQDHIRTVCTRVQFAADVCPKGSVYGHAIAYSPLLDFPLQGNVYLRSSDNPLPDLVADLRGPAHQPLRIELVGRTDSVKGALRNTFDVVPDAPVSYFRLRLFGGKKGLIVNSRNICLGANRAAVRLDAHNGRRAKLRPAAFNPRCKKVHRKLRRAKRKRAAQKRRAAKRRAGKRRARR
ncbi:MAG: hypothetical protein WDZ46_09740 [Solirubrobacterales bacterium]